jgi:autotransporter translocation and assembly factor TamB
VRGRLRARGFQTAWLATVSPQLRRVRGRIDGAATIAGRLGAPRIEGRLAWHRGRIVVGPAPSRGPEDGGAEP